MATSKREPPSAGWGSYQEWDFDGLKERLEDFIKSINTSALLKHVEEITGRKATLSKPFSAGQFWCLFEFILDDDSLVIARVRLPRHPDTIENTTEESGLYTIQCEVATIKYIQHKAINVPLPKLYAFEPGESERAKAVGSCYMLLEGFYGDIMLFDHFDFSRLSSDQQEHFIRQWTAIQAELATLTFPKIGSISSFSTEGSTEPTIGPLSRAVVENFRTAGPFDTAKEYFMALGESRFITMHKDLSSFDLEFERDSDGSDDGEDGDSWAGGDSDGDKYSLLAPLIFRDIVSRTALFDGSEERSFQLNHMQMLFENILIDDEFNILAITDWEFTQTAPVEVNHYPDPIPLLSSDAVIQKILEDPEHVSQSSLSQQIAGQKIYQETFLEAERALEEKGRKVQPSIAKTLGGPASRIYDIVEKMAGGSEAEALVFDMVYLGFGYEGTEAKKYVEDMETKMEDYKKELQLT